MMALTPATPMPGAGTVGTAVGVCNAGDLVHSGSEVDPATGLNIGKPATLERQWANYVADFGLLPVWSGVTSLTFGKYV